MRRTEPLGDDFGCEPLRRQPGQLRAEVDDEGFVEPNGGEQFELHRQRGEPEEGLVRVEKFARVRLEHHRTRAFAGCLAKVARAPEHRLMAAMDAVEIADGDHGAAIHAGGGGVGATAPRPLTAGGGAIAPLGGGGGALGAPGGGGGGGGLFTGNGGVSLGDAWTLAPGRWYGSTLVLSDHTLPGQRPEPDCRGRDCDR